ncbi:MAG: serine protease [Desulfobacterales bacterium]|uniref:Serine protease n=1 Tax=Candidatus Desulfatibia vada TaxID=2841696 RepID=A0A8J6P929_9BACT|nr:serine protease [Candidatus Desulfatibia vada]MBL6970488.1 serine protease [Desulfobacterales bacterium]MBL7217042.1 serine protease [Desulfobacteraceae bacterium]
MRYTGKLFVTVPMFIIIGWTAVWAAGLAPHQIANRLMPSVVLVVNADSNMDPVGFGSGFVIADGIVVTNAHVIENGPYVLAKLVNDENFFGGSRSILAYSDKWDLAVLSISGLGAPPIKFGDSNALLIGDAVYAIGNPHGLTGTFSAGNVSAKRNIKGVSYIQMTAPVSPGSSGGPVVDANGSLVAVATAQFQTGQSLNFAVPVSYLKSLLKNANINTSQQQRKPREQQKLAQDKPQKGRSIARKPTLKKWFDQPNKDHTPKAQRARQSQTSPKSSPHTSDKQRRALIIGDDRTDVYYWPWCPGYQEVPTKSKIKFRSSSQAEQAGFKKAHSCPKIGSIR